MCYIHLMKKFNEHFLGNNYLSNSTLNDIKKIYGNDFKNLKKRKCLLLFPSKRKFYFQYKNIHKLKEKNNTIYTNYKLNETEDFLSHIKGYSLDLNQRKCVLNEENALLVVAGAGSGKSLTIIAKICYLIEYLGFKESEILCISFTNASSKSLQDSIQKYYGYSINVYTFHKLALKILENETFKIANPDLLEYLIEEFYNAIIFNFPKLIELTVQYFYPYQVGTTEQYKNLLNQKKFILFQRKISQFIHLFKANKEDENLLYEYIKKVFSNQEYYFLIHVIVIWNLYKTELSSQKEIDFDDMILKAISLLQKKEFLLPYRYIIIDEYQDSSLLRCKLIQVLLEKTKAKIMAVGDDFQSIYRFSGCDLEIFLNFKKYFPNPDILFITNTYRNSQELIDIAGSFIMKNKSQIKKNLYSNKHLNYPIKIIYYEDQKKVFLKLLEYLLKKGIKKILVLGRNRKDIYPILDNKINYNNETYHYQDLSFKYMTVHQSKGLEEDCVILIHLENSTMGFPNKLENDNVFRFLNTSKETFAYEEERRLFYVALTRTKNENYLLVPKNKESIFVKELLRDFSTQIEILSIK